MGISHKNKLRDWFWGGKREDYYAIHFEFEEDENYDEFYEHWKDCIAR